MLFRSINSTGQQLPYAYSTDVALNSNDLYTRLTSTPAYPNSRSLNQVIQTLTGPAFNLVPVQDFEKTFARKLDSTQYTYNRQLGMLSLSQPLQTDEVLGVAYQYSYNGRIYQVGEFSQDVPPDSASKTQKVLFLKLLKKYFHLDR